MQCSTNQRHGGSVTAEGELGEGAAFGFAVPAREVIVVRDGALALDYLRREGEYASRVEGNPAVILRDLKLPKAN